MRKSQADYNRKHQDKRRDLLIAQKGGHCQECGYSAFPSTLFVMYMKEAVIPWSRVLRYDIDLTSRCFTLACGTCAEVVRQGLSRSHPDVASAAAPQST